MVTSLKEPCRAYSLFSWKSVLYLIALGSSQR